MLLKAYNKALIQDKERTYLTVAVATAGTTLTVSAVDGNAWADNDYIIVGEIGNKTTEVMQIAAAVTDGTALTIDRSGSAGGLRFAHSIGEPVYRIDFNQIQFLRSNTNNSGTSTQLTLIEIQPDDEFTRYEDTTNTTGYGFVRFYNTIATAYSSYSDGVNYDISGEGSSRDPKTLWTVRKKIRQLVDELEDEKLTDQMIDDGINDKQRDIAHQRLWSFYEVERSLSSVANQFAYDIPSTVQTIYSARYDTQPLSPINKNKWDLLHWNSDSSTSVPTAMCIWNNQLLLYPRPSTAADTTTLGGALSATAESMTVASTASFKRGDYYRVIIDSEVIYATNETATTLTGLLRGREGTTAVAHSNGATVTERNIVYNGHSEPTNLMDTQDRTSIPEPDVLCWGTAADLALLLGKETLHDRLLAKYERGIKELENKYALKQTGSFGRIKNQSEVMSDVSGYNNPNLYISDLS